MVLCVTFRFQEDFRFSSPTLTLISSLFFGRFIKSVFEVRNHRRRKLKNHDIFIRGNLLSVYSGENVQEVVRGSGKMAQNTNCVSAP